MATEKVDESQPAARELPALLKKSEERFRSLVQTANDAIVCSDASGKITYWNPAAARIFGYESSEVIGKPITLMMPARFRAPHEKGLRRLATAGEVRVVGKTVELIGRKKAGNEFPVELSLSSWKVDEDVYFAAVIHDITARKTIEAALEAERKQLAVTLRSIGDGVITTDVEGRVVLVNRVAENLTGWSQAKAKGRPLEEVFNIINEKTRKAAPNPIRKVLKTASAVGLANHTALISKDGTERSIADSCAPIADAQGNLLGAVLVFRDVTKERRLEEAGRRAKALSDALNDINAAITSTLDADEIIERAVAKAARVLGCKATVRMGGDRKPASGSTRLSAALTVKNEILGFILFNRAPAAFAEAELDFVTKLAVSVSMAIANARSYEAEHKVAETLQEALLNMPDRIPGVEFGHMYRSATQRAKVGGDFYDLFELEHDRLGILIGDIAGKGLEAAALTYLVKSTVKAYAFENFFPASIMAKTNELVRRALPSPSEFVTLFFGVLDKRTGHLAYCSGGHPPALLHRENGSIEWLTTASPLVGAFANLSFVDAGVIVHPGDRLILYTDGVTEARANSRFFGDEGLIKAIVKQPAAVGKVPELIFERVIKHTGGTLADDVALLAVGLLPGENDHSDKII